MKNKLLFNIASHKTNLIVCLSLCLILIFTSSLTAQPLGAGHGKFIGSAAGDNVDPLFDDYFNQITPGNAGKWQYREVTQDKNEWGGLDMHYNYAKQHGMPFKMHVLVWGQQYPNWIGSVSNEVLAEEIEEWIRLVGERYPDIDYIDVVNEPLHAYTNSTDWPYAERLKQALGGNGATGWDWVIKAFQLARKYCPKAKLVLNDYNVINDTYSTTRYLEIINLLKDRGLIDVIGEQAHFYEGTIMSFLTSNLNRLAATGLPIHISEFDLNFADDTQQLNRYKQIFPMFWENPAVQGITFWGYKQGEIWRTNAYLIRSNGEERPALKWLREYLSSGNFRSHQSGNWNDLTTWEQHDGASWIYPASAKPGISNRVIIISNGHTVNFAGSDSVDQLFIDKGGILSVAPASTLKIKNGLGIDLDISGTLIVKGEVTRDDSVEIRVNDGGAYTHSRDGGTLPTIKWGSGALLKLTEIPQNPPQNLNQDFFNVEWDDPEQAKDICLNWHLNTIAGFVKIINTGNFNLSLVTPVDVSHTLTTIRGDLIQTGGSFSAADPNKTGSSEISHFGDLNITGGTFSFGKSNPCKWDFHGGSIIFRNTNVQNHPVSLLMLNGESTSSLELKDNTIESLPIEVGGGGVLDVGSNSITGSGRFVLNPEATLKLSHTEGINGVIKTTGALVLNKLAGYTFNGSAAQNTGLMLPDTVGSLNIENANLVLSKDVSIAGTLDIKIKPSPGSHKIKFLPGSTLKYSGTTAITSSDFEFPETVGPSNLNIANVSGLTLHANRIISGIVSVGGRLTLGNNTLTAGNATNTGSTRFVLTNGTGVLKLSGINQDEKYFPVGTTSGFAPVWITNSGTADIEGVSVVGDAAAIPDAGRVKAKWTITEDNNGGGNYTIRFGWMSSYEDTPFRINRRENAYIFDLSDTTEAGQGEYSRQLTTQPYSLERSGITKLGSFGVGKFGTITAVEEDNLSAPSEFSLSQNYPNPFNPTTNFGVRISEFGLVTLKIYDVLGNEVAVLINEEKFAGDYHVPFNALALSSGVYYARLNAGGKSMTRKIILLK